MNHINKEGAIANSPEISQNWVVKSKEERINLVQEELNNYKEYNTSGDNPKRIGDFFHFNLFLSEVKYQKATIYDMSGRLIYEVNLSGASETSTINLTGMAKGMYLVHIHSDNAFVTKKLILE